MDDFLVRFAQCGTPGDVSTCAFSTVREGLIVALLSIGTLIGALIGAPTADFLGRRRAMQVECLVFIIGVIIQIATFSAWAQFAVGRLISGFGVGALSAAVPMYQAETAPPQIRGTLTATYQLFITFGILVAYAISIATRSMSGSGSWRTVVGIGLIWPVMLSVGIQMMPESPRQVGSALPHIVFFASPQRAKELIPHLSEANSHYIIKREAEEIRTEVEYEKQVKGGWIDCFRPGNKTLYRTILGMSLQSLQQLTGANYFFYYGATIFTSVGIQDSFVTQIILGAVNFVCTFGGLYIMEKFGRRIPLILGGLWQSAWLFVFAAAGTAKIPQNNPGIGNLMIVSACMFILGYAMTWAPGVWILIGETFPTRTRAKQGAIATASNWLWNFLLAFFTPFITKDIQFRYGFVFASCNLLGAAVVYLFLYESSDISLEAVDLMYNDPNCTPRNSRKWAPPGYSSRRDMAEQTRAAEAHKPLHGAEEERFEKAHDTEGAGPIIATLAVEHGRSFTSSSGSARLVLCCYAAVHWMATDQAVRLDSYTARASYEMRLRAPRTLASSIPSHLDIDLLHLITGIYVPFIPLIIILCPCTLQHPHDILNSVHFLTEAVAQQRQGIQGYQGDFVGHAISKFAPFDGRIIADALERMAILETKNVELKGQDREIGTRCSLARARDPRTAQFHIINSYYVKSNQARMNGTSSIRIQTTSKSPNNGTPFHLDQILTAPAATPSNIMREESEEGWEIYRSARLKLVTLAGGSGISGTGGAGAEASVKMLVCDALHALVAIAWAQGVVEDLGAGAMSIEIEEKGWLVSRVAEPSDTHVPHQPWQHDFIAPTFTTSCASPSSTTRQRAAPIPSTSSNSFSSAATISPLSKIDSEEIWCIKGELVTTAIVMGLHRDSGRSKMPFEVAGHCRWAWQAFMFGCPLTIASHHFDMELPLYCDPALDATGHLYEGNIALFKLTYILGTIMDDTISLCPVTYDAVLAMDRSL
ncbi:hypothetical protein EW146_g7392 [Bondarzewia mesenterica]|uniref:Major facilitator superfamily (MFS) profile domain-containing protein n=1 Tax=Bondarzewia mesenterica TaxID=1095465 RepID=A0A4S4LL20_9AGAM|nr:hypothetical protein EW146_g7392 [Bondarzewia mesenterica]